MKFIKNCMLYTYAHKYNFIELNVTIGKKMWKDKHIFKAFDAYYELMDRIINQLIKSKHIVPIPLISCSLWYI